MDCLKPSDNIVFSVDVLVHVTILFVFLTVFFMFYISKIMKSSIEKEVHENITNGISSLLNKFSSGTFNIKNLTKQLPLDNIAKKYDEPSDVVTVNNKMVFTNAILTCVTLILTIFIICFIVKMSCNQCIPIMKILKENAILFTFIGVIEFLFFKFVALKYIPVEPSYIIKSAIETLQKQN